MKLKMYRQSMAKLKQTTALTGKALAETVQDKGEPMVEVSLAAMNGLVAALQSGSNQLARNEKTGERTEKALTRDYRHTRKSSRFPQ